MFWQSALYWYENWVEGWTTQTIWALPLWIPLLPLPVGFGLLVLQSIVQIAVLTKERGEDRNSRSLHP
jgi:TRAP-type C4-dicarboxylate transport system permease small subunit